MNQNYRNSLVIKANPAAVYAALTTSEGLRGWWTGECEVAGNVGGAIHVRFARTQKEFRIERLEPGREVRWACVVAHIAADKLTHKDEWVGTQMVFVLQPQGAEHTRLEFEHVGLVPSLECFGMCHDGWQYYLGSLRQFVETGAGTPYVAKAAAA